MNINEIIRRNVIRWQMSHPQSQLRIQMAREKQARDVRRRLMRDIHQGRLASVATAWPA